MEQQDNEALDGLRRYGEAVVESLDDEARARRVVAAAMTGFAPAGLRWKRRLLALAAASALFVAANAGLALASNPAVPGDPLYPVDRFYERIGEAIGVRDDFAFALERLEEASVLVQRERISLALATAAEGLERLDGAPGLDVAQRALMQSEREIAALEEVSGFRLSREVRGQSARLLVTARDVVQAAQSGADPSEIAAGFADEAMALAETARRLAPIDRIPAGPPEGVPIPTRPGPPSQTEEPIGD